MPTIALLVIDMLNAYDHEDGDALAEQARERMAPLQKLIAEAREGKAELVYANDNFDDFTATSETLKQTALEGKHPEVVEPILPPEGALFVEKVRHSAFYESSLNHLLNIKDIETVVLAGPGDGAVHPLHGAGRLHPRIRPPGRPDGLRPARRRARRCRAEHDGAQHERRARRPSRTPSPTRGSPSG